ncbi:MAG: tRNA (adenosine(37)-N6)-threonylcarbamoyltransferase complex dimerization subunit type 1 TsaB [Bacteroidota bacterium]
MPTPLLLHLESTTTACSVGLSEAGELLAIREVNNGYSHAENLAQFIDAVFSEAGREGSQLQGVVVSKGPGSYTGLRIGVATAKGLAYSLKIPLLAINTLQAMSHGAIRSLEEQGEDPSLYHFCPMLDARRMEVYTARYDAALQEQTATHALIVESDSFDTLLQSQRTVFFGTGAAKCRELLEKYPNARVEDDRFPSARDMVALAEDAYAREAFEDLAYFEPFYLKDFVATTPKQPLHRP